VLGSEPDLAVAGEVGDGADVPDAVSRLRPDVVLMDVRMPLIDGIAATRTLPASAEAPKVLVVTTFGNDEYVYDALLKRSPPEEIEQGVRTVARGESLLFPASIRSLVRSYGTTRQTTGSGGSPSASRRCFA
jgi:DNA-binding NarL/FixJ family response regulator